MLLADIMSQDHTGKQFVKNMPMTENVGNM